ncbi:transposase, partial [Brevibacillus borstelensis]
MGDFYDVKRADQAVDQREKHEVSGRRTVSVKGSIRRHNPRNAGTNVTNKIVPMIKEWQNRPLQAVYAVVFLDAIHFKVKQDGAIVNKAAYMVIGI